MGLTSEQNMYIGLAAAGAGVFLMVWALSQLLMSADFRRKKSFKKAAYVGSHSGLLRTFRPLARLFGGFVGAMAAKAELKAGQDPSQSFLLKTRVGIQRQLLAGGVPEGYSADEFLGFQFACLFIGAAFGALVGFRLGYPALALVTTVLGFFWPTMWLGGVVKKRQFEIQKSLPYALDLLTLAVEAGLDFTTAVGKIVEKLGGTALAFELGIMLREIQLGKTRVEALRDLGRRVSLPEMTSVTSSLIQAEELGASLGPILRVQGEQLRDSRSQRAEKLAMEAPVKILFPLIAFIFPTTFIIIGGPILLKYLIPMFFGQ